MAFPCYLQGKHWEVAYQVDLKICWFDVYSTQYAKHGMQSCMYP